MHLVPKIDMRKIRDRDGIYGSLAAPPAATDHCIGALVWICLLGLAPAYLLDLCCSSPGTRGRSSLRSMERRGLPFVPFASTSTNQTRAFSVVGPTVWNGLPLAQRLLPRIFNDTFCSSLETVF